MTQQSTSCIWCGHERAAHEPGARCQGDAQCQCTSYTEPQSIFRWECAAPLGGGNVCGASALNTVLPVGDCARGHRGHWRKIDDLVAIARPRVSTEERLAIRRAEGTIPPPSVVVTHVDAPATPQTTRATRERLPGERAGRTRVFRLGYTHKDGTPDVMHLYFQTGEYPDGRLGEVFVKADRTGSMARGTLDVVSIFISMMLQYGVPLQAIVDKLRHTRFAPDGFTRDAEFPSCSSPLDLLAQWLTRVYGKEEKT